MRVNQDPIKSRSRPQRSSVDPQREQTILSDLRGLRSKAIARTPNPITLNQDPIKTSEVFS